MRRVLVAPLFFGVIAPARAEDHPGSLRWKHLHLNFPVKG